MQPDARPLLSIVVPTIGRPTLKRALHSLLWQQGHALSWEAVVVGDTYAGDGRDFRAALADVPALLRDLGGPLRYVAHDGGIHAWGHPQRNHGATIARGRWLAWLGDDDIYLPGAFAAIEQALRAAETRSVPHLFRWISPWKYVYWEQSGWIGEAPGHIDAECIVTPNDPERLGVWTNEYTGDYAFIAATVANYGGVQGAVFRPEIIAQAQPSPVDDWTINYQPPAQQRYGDELALFEYTEAQAFDQDGNWLAAGTGAGATRA